MSFESFCNGKLILSSATLAERNISFSSTIIHSLLSATAWTKSFYLPLIAPDSLEND